MNNSDNFIASLEHLSTEKLHQLCENLEKELEDTYQKMEPIYQERHALSKKLSLVEETLRERSVRRQVYELAVDFGFTSLTYNGNPVDFLRKLLETK